MRLSQLAALARKSGMRIMAWRSLPTDRARLKPLPADGMIQSAPYLVSWSSIRLQEGPCGTSLLG